MIELTFSGTKMSTEDVNLNIHI